MARTWEQNYDSYRKRLVAAGIRGWDDALIGNRACPYHRIDFQNAWRRGHQLCLENKPLPLGYKLHMKIFDEETVAHEIKRRKHASQ